MRGRSSPILVNFGHLLGSTNFRQQISCTLLLEVEQNLAWLGQGLANEHLLSEFSELWTAFPGSKNVNSGYLCRVLSEHYKI